MHFTKRDQDQLKAAALAPTGSTAWMQDAVAIGAAQSIGGAIKAVAVFQNFRHREADFHFAMLNGSRITAETVKAMLAIAFGPRGFNLVRLWGHISAGNAAAQVAAIKSGAQFEYRVRSGAKDADDVIVVSMLRAGPQLPLPGDTITTHAT